MTPTAGGSSTTNPTITMASGDCKKDYRMDDNRTDSGIDSYRSILKDAEESYGKLAGDPAEDSDGADKFCSSISSTADERMDSAYGSSSLTVDSLSEIVEDCSLSTAEETLSSTPTGGLSEQEENFLTIITEDGDTYVVFTTSFFAYFFVSSLV